MLAVVEQEDPPAPPLHQEGDQRSVGLGGVAVSAGEDQVVRPVVGRLASAGTDVVQGDHVFMGLAAAIGTHGTMLGEQPIAMRLHGTTGGTAKTGDGNCGMSTRSTCHKIPG